VVAKGKNEIVSALQASVFQYQCLKVQQHLISHARGQDDETESDSHSKFSTRFLCYKISILCKECVMSLKEDAKVRHEFCSKTLT